MHRIALLLTSLAVACGCTEPQFREMEGERILREYEESLKEAPARRTGNVMITVDKIVVDQRDSARLSAAWRYADENILAGSAGGRLARQNGIRIGVARDGFAAELQASVEKAKNAQTTREFLRTLSGRPAVVEVGRNTYAEVLRYHTPRGENVVLERAFIGGSLVIKPTILPDDSVHVRLYPRFTSRQGSSINLTDSATEVILEHGQPLVIGGLDQSSESAGFALFSWGSQHSQRKLTLVVTAYIEGAP